MLNADLGTLRPLIHKSYSYCLFFTSSYRTFIGFIVSPLSPPPPLRRTSPNDLQNVFVFQQIYSCSTKPKMLLRHSIPEKRAKSTTLYQKIKNNMNALSDLNLLFILRNLSGCLSFIMQINVSDHLNCSPYFIPFRNAHHSWGVENFHPKIRKVHVSR